MTKKVQFIRSYFAKLGLESEIADIYISLSTHGPQTISELARSSRIERTRIYRLLDVLVGNNLIEIETEYKRQILRAAPIGNIRILISKKEQQLHELNNSLKLLERVFMQSSLSTPTTRVQVYRGIYGIKQMFWNETKATTENYSILYENMQHKTKLAFFERWVQRCNERGLTFKSIFGDHFIASQQNWYGRHSNERLKNWVGRYMSPEVFPITHSMVVYNNVLAYYTWKGNEIFGLEVHNEQMATMQRRVFEILWSQAAPTNDLTGQPLQEPKLAE